MNLTIPKQNRRRSSHALLVQQISELEKDRPWDKAAIQYKREHISKLERWMFLPQHEGTKAKRTNRKHRN